MKKEKKIVYKHIRVKDKTHRELKKFKNLYELQDERDYSIDDVINLLMRDRAPIEFDLPITKDREKAIDSFEA